MLFSTYAHFLQPYLAPQVAPVSMSQLDVCVTLAALGVLMPPRLDQISMLDNVGVLSSLKLLVRSLGLLLSPEHCLLWWWRVAAVEVCNEYCMLYAC